MRSLRTLDSTWWCKALAIDPEVAAELDAADAQAVCNCWWSER